MRCFTWAVFVVLVATPLPALAYLDPGTGSMLLQALIAGLLTVTLAFRRLWIKLAGGIVRLMRRMPRPGPSVKDGAS